MADLLFVHHRGGMNGLSMGMVMISSYSINNIRTSVLIYGGLDGPGTPGLVSSVIRTEERKPL